MNATTLRWIGDWPWYAGVIAATVLAIAAWVLYRKDTGGMRSGFRFVLPLLRALAIFHDGQLDGPSVRQGEPRHFFRHVGRQETDELLADLEVARRIDIRREIHAEALDER